MVSHSYRSQSETRVANFYSGRSHLVDHFLRQSGLLDGG